MSVGECLDVDIAAAPVGGVQLMFLPTNTNLNSLSIHRCSLDLVVFLSPAPYLCFHLIFSSVHRLPFVSGRLQHGFKQTVRATAQVSSHGATGSESITIGKLQIHSSRQHSIIPNANHQLLAATTCRKLCPSDCEQHFTTTHKGAIGRKATDGK